MKLRLHVVAFVLLISMNLIPSAAFALDLPPGYPGAPLPLSPIAGQLDSSDIVIPGAMSECYSVELSAGDRIRFFAERPGDEGLWLDFVGPDGTMAPLDSVGDWPLRITYLVPQGGTGTYYLTLLTVSDTPGPYSLSYTIDHEPFSLKRIAGQDRYETAVELSKEGWPAGGTDTAVIATGDDYADALCASGLAGATGGPALLTRPTYLPQSVGEELSRLGVRTVYIIGGESAISPEVEEEILELDGVESLHRLGGSDRYETSRLVAEETYRIGSVRPGPTFLVRGDCFADAVICAYEAARCGRPVLLTRPTSLDPATKALAVRNQFVLIVGGPAAVSERIEQELVDACPAISTGEGSVTRVSGADRYATAVQMARSHSFASAPDGRHLQVAVATGEQFPDALVAGAYLARLRGCLLFTGSDLLPSVTAEYISSTVQPGADAVMVGGLSAMSAGAEVQLRDALERTVAP